VRAAYVGHEVLTFTDYTDLETGRALRAEPGGVYDIAPASGRVVPEFPEPWFARVEPPAPETTPKAIPAPDDEPDDE
jgi:hypothetical protein